MRGLARAYLENQPWPWNPAQLLIGLLVLFVVALRNPAGVVTWVGLITIVPITLFVNRDNVAACMVPVAVLLLLGYQIGRRRQAQSRLKVEEERTEVDALGHLVVAAGRTFRRPRPLRQSSMAW